MAHNDTIPDYAVVKRVLGFYDPWNALGIQRTTFLKGKRKPTEFVVYDRFASDASKRTKRWHYGRVEYFVRQLNDGHKIDPIEIDMTWHGRSVTGIALIDGHHRLCAADVVNAAKIPASMGGVVDIIRYLAGQHSRRPEL